jgi:hypothetical protein
VAAPASTGDGSAWRRVNNPLQIAALCRHGGRSER